MNKEILSADYEGVVAQYGDAMLFIGFDLGDGQFQVTVYPGYRYPGDDRVHGHIGIFDTPIGTPWEEIMRRVDAYEQEALENYQVCARLRSGRAGSRAAQRRVSYDSGVDHIGESFRESWAGFSLQLARKGEVVRGDVRFTGDPNRGFLAHWNDSVYTVRVFDTGSMVVVPGDLTNQV